MMEFLGFLAWIFATGMCLFALASGTIIGRPPKYTGSIAHISHRDKEPWNFWVNWGLYAVAMIGLPILYIREIYFPA